MSLLVRSRATFRPASLELLLRRRLGRNPGAQTVRRGRARAAAGEGEKTTRGFEHAIVNGLLLILLESGCLCGCRCGYLCRYRYLSSAAPGPAQATARVPIPRDLGYVTALAGVQSGAHAGGHDSLSVVECVAEN